ncbi:MAG TPA: SUMF1/EgtB/PvdO family nonheme iron enzyme [Thermoanaerobaculia bacterium]|nr:SUMF1/EgtB/PvdO family nonheme iron enzyme [Thermoanaerobaculia bacterium]
MSHRNGFKGKSMTAGQSSTLSLWRAARAASRRFFDETLTPAAYEARPIALRHPFVFYEGHLVAFAVNTLLTGALSQPGLDPSFEVLFERGIDPPADGGAAPETRWPTRAAVTAYVRRADAAIDEALSSAACVAHEDAALTIFEHELMHQETLRYMLHRLPYAQKRPPARARASETGGTSPRAEGVRVPAGVATLGVRRGGIPFGWDNEFPQTCRMVPEFTIDALPVTNGDFLEFVEAGGYGDASLWAPGDAEWLASHAVSHPAFWRKEGGSWSWIGQFGLVPLPPTWPVWVSHAEASAYARWCGARLPTEAEFHRAAFGTRDGPERRHPWGDEEPAERHGNFGAHRDDPVPVGSRPEGASAWGVHELVGNGWEWTSTPFAGFDGFAPMRTYPRYSADFFDGRHFVLKGASPATPAPLVRRTFRNWFQPRYPYVYAKFRCVRP